MSREPRTSAREWPSQVLRAASVAAFVAGFETALIAWRARLDAAAVFAVWWVLQALALLGGLLLLTLLRSAWRSWASLELRWRSHEKAPISVHDGLAAAGVALPLLFTALWLTALWLLRQFKNQELLALAFAGAALPSIAMGSVIWVRCAGLARAIRLRCRSRVQLAFAAGLPAAAACATAIALLLAVQAAGLRQVDPALCALPVAAVLGVGVWSNRRLLDWSRPAVATGVLIGSLTIGASAASLSPFALGSVGRFGLWSASLLRALRVATDFDSDGYSGWFAGGDCGPFDARVHPGAVELPHDGLDNNCVGGDGGRERWPAATRSGSRPALHSPLNFVLITIETLRADRVSLLGYARATTPRLQQLAHDFLVFERLYAPAPSTRLSLAALLSGRLPSRVDWEPQARAKQMRKILPSTPWLPEILAQSGFTTLAIHTDFRAFTEVESAGFQRGFHTYDTSTRLAYVGGTLQGFPGGQQVDRALEYLDRTPARPWFLWLHLMEPHYLYEQSPDVPRFGNDEQSLYDADIAEADRQVGRLVDGLALRGLLANTLLLVCGDHGEEFGEHGARWHGSNLYEAQVRSVALLRVPGLPGRRLSAPVVLSDFAPTVSDILGIARGFERWEGRNLLPWFTGEPPPSTPIFLEHFRVDSGGRAVSALLEWPHKLIYSAEGPSFELYDLVQDPEERHNLYSPDEPRSRSLMEKLVRAMERARPSVQ